MKILSTCFFLIKNLLQKYGVYLFGKGQYFP